MSIIGGHDAHTMWRLRRQKTILKLLPSILKKSNSQLIGTILLIVLAIFGSSSLGVVADGYGIQKQINLIGHCPAPLVLNANGCFSEQIITSLLNGKNATTTNFTPAGTYYFGNGTQFGR